MNSLISQTPRKAGRFSGAIKHGFTIVELLIVIVVIAILAAISIVAYTGIQNNANDSSVQADLRQTSTKLEVYRQTDTNTRYPYSVANLETLELQINIPAYRQDVQRNFIYCLSPDRQSYALVAMSKSGKRYIVSNVVSNGEFDDSVAWNSVGTLCSGINSSLEYRTTGFDTDGSWRPWVGGPSQ